MTEQKASKKTGALLNGKTCFPIFLKNNDSFNYFRKYGGLILTGPTHTNVNDIGVIIKQTL